MKKWLILVLILSLALTACAQQGTHSQGGTTPEASTAPELPPEPTTTVPETTAEPDQVYISFSREGTVSTIPVTMVDGSTGYRIATNPEIFRRETASGLDVFWYTNWESQPNIYYSVSYNADMTLEFMKEGLLHQNDGATSEPVKIGQYDAVAVYVSKEDPLRTQQHFYLVAHNGGCYMIETQFVLEMYEGLFPQMRALFDTFVIAE